MTTDQVLALLGMLTDTITAQQQIIERLQAENERLKDDDPSSEMEVGHER